MNQLNINKKKTDKAFVLNKKVGQTPLEVLNIFKEKNKEYKNVKLAYAGRLDPLAEGRLLVLSGEFCKRRDKFLNLDKEYEFEILLNFNSDSHDVLGLAEYDENFNIEKFSNKKLNKILEKLLGKQKFKYPVFSSKAVLGKPLFLWKLENRIEEITIPEKEVEIFHLSKIEQRIATKEKLRKEIFDKINSIKKVTDKKKALGNDFRRVDIRRQWNKIFDEITPDKKFLIIKIKAIVSSGTYMRVLADKIAIELGTYGLAISIKRTKIGVYKKFFNRFGFWIKKF